MNSNITKEEISYCLDKLPMEFSRKIDNLAKSENTETCLQHYKDLKELISNHVSPEHLKMEEGNQIKDAYRFIAEYTTDWIKDRVIRREIEKADALLKVLGLLQQETSDVYIGDGYDSALNMLSLISEKHKKQKEKLYERDIVENLWEQQIAISRKNSAKV